MTRTISVKITQYAFFGFVFHCDAVHPHLTLSSQKEKGETTFLYISRTSSDAAIVFVSFHFVDFRLFVCFSQSLSNLCKDKRIEVILVFMSINSSLLWPSTLVCLLKH